MLGDRLLQADQVILPGERIQDICSFCTREVAIQRNAICHDGVCPEAVLTDAFHCVNAFPGFNSSVFIGLLTSCFEVCREPLTEVHGCRLRNADTEGR